MIPSPRDAFAAELQLEAVGARHAHARQEPLAVARRGLTMRYAGR